MDIPQSKMQLAEALKLRIRVGKHVQDLEHALHVLVKEQVEILERQLGQVGKTKRVSFFDDDGENSTRQQESKQ
jgi:hypothetical protein